MIFLTGLLAFLADVAVDPYEGSSGGIGILGLLVPFLLIGLVVLAAIIVVVVVLVRRQKKKNTK